MTFSTKGDKARRALAKSAGDESKAAAASDAELTDPKVVGLWRQRLDQYQEQDRPDANLIALVSANGRIENVLGRPSPGIGLPEDVAEGSGIDDVWPGDTAQRFKRSIRKALQSRQSYCNQFPDPQRESHIECICVPQGRDRVMLIVRDITATREEISKLEDLAFRDASTGLPNREWLITELSSIVERVGVRQGRGAVICLDMGELDATRSITGEDRTEAVIAILASRLMQALRGANIPEESDDERYSAIARINRSRFAVVLPDINTGTDAEAVATRLAGVLEAPVAVGKQTFSTHVDTGIALYPQDGGTAVELLDNATIAMQEARNSETSQNKFHSGTVGLESFERQDLVVELEAALEKGAFKLNYLPIVTAKDRDVTATEVLLRWPRPLFGDKPIAEVIKAADFTGVMLPIGRWVFASACEQLAQWQRNGHPNLRMAVNVSAQEFARARLVERTESILADVGIDPVCIDLEITEQLLFRDAMRDFPICRGLAELGVRVVVDDFGTGVCSFEHLSGSPVHGVKIHEKFVAGVDSDASKHAACAAITAMAHALEIQVTAEGVESEEQAAALAQIGCDYLQGFAFCLPSPADELTAFLDAGGANGSKESQS
ncbi:MAG: putative bifunctional diguanylate cyclase/phosphodiesterase [Gammaproteobacteria bacterium]